MSESKPKTAQDVYEIICGLSAEERDELSAMLEPGRNDGWASPEIEQAWLEEARRRSQLRAEGKTRSVVGNRRQRDYCLYLACIRPVLLLAECRCIFNEPANKGTQRGRAIRFAAVGILCLTVFVFGVPSG